MIEVTSKTTRRHDERKKLTLYRDLLKVPEYFLFDPTEDYLKPLLQGFRLANRSYVPINPIAGRLPSDLLGLHLERDGKRLRLFDPVKGVRLLTPREHAMEERQRAAEERQALRRNASAVQERQAPTRRRPRGSVSLSRTTASGERSRPSDAGDRHPIRRIRPISPMIRGDRRPVTGGRLPPAPGQYLPGVSGILSSRLRVWEAQRSETREFRTPVVSAFPPRLHCFFIFPTSL